MNINTNTNMNINTNLNIDNNFIDQLFENEYFIQKLKHTILYQNKLLIDSENNKYINKNYEEFNKLSIYEFEAMLNYNNFDEYKHLIIESCEKNNLKDYYLFYDYLNYNSNKNTLKHDIFRKIINILIESNIKIKNIFDSNEYSYLKSSGVPKCSNSIAYFLLYMHFNKLIYRINITLQEIITLSGSMTVDDFFNNLDFESKELFKKIVVKPLYSL